MNVFGPGYRDMLKARTIAWHMLVTYKEAIGAAQQALDNTVATATGYQRREHASGADDYPPPSELVKGMQLVLGAADAQLASGLYGAAVEGYKMAGRQGWMIVEAAGLSSVHPYSAMAEKLSNVRTPATEADALLAKSTAHAMYSRLARRSYSAGQEPEGCRPPYFYDNSGVRRPKPQCQQQAQPQTGQVAAATVPSDPLQTAAQALVATIRSAVQLGQSPRWTREGGQSSVMWGPTAAFQRAYNKGARGSLKVDGAFGPDTTTALQQVVGTNVLLAVQSQQPLAVTGCC